MRTRVRLRCSARVASPCLAAILLLMSPTVGAQRPEQFAFASGADRLSGELTRPTRPRAAVVLVHGSGPDGASDYRAQAAMFARMGVAALAYDKRGWGASGGDWHRRPIALLAQDAIAAGAALRARLRVPVGYWGISQGGWVLARVAARDRRAVFLVGVAGAGVSPFQQERWHKDRMAHAAAYPAWARRLADHYWSAALDLMIRLEAHPHVLPTVLENERAGSSFGLGYDPVPDWRSSRAPLLLLYGTRDELEPWFDSGPRIAAARPRGAVTIVAAFPSASHALTTRTTGLAFDWGAAYHPAYAATMRAFIDKALSGRLEATVRRRSPVPWPLRPRSAAPLVLLSLFGLPIAWSALLGARRSTSARALALAGLVGWAALVALLALVVHPTGSFFDPAARFPAWGWLFPAAAAAATAAALMVAVAVVRRREPASSGFAAAATIAFFAFWW